MLDQAVERAPDRAAIVEGDLRLPWREFRRQVRQLAGGLARLGVGRGDRVATLLPNGVPFCLAVFAAAELGAIAVPLNTKLRRAELAFMIADSAPRVLLADPAFYDEVAAVRDQLPGAHHVVTGEAAPPAGTRQLAGLLVAAPPAGSATPGVGDDPAFVMYTSGTTGRPKGA